MQLPSVPTPLDLVFPPFNKSQVSAGLRKLYHQPDVWTINFWETPLVLRPCKGKIIGIVAEMQIQGQLNWELLVLKYPLGTSRAGLLPTGLRETSVYRWLRDLLPMQTPALVTAASKGQWLLMQAVPTGKEPQDYSADDLRQVISAAVALHDRFWGLEEELKIYNWLGRPLVQEFTVYQQVAQNAFNRLQKFPTSHLSQHWNTIVQQSLKLMPQIARYFKYQPRTLIHGDYWLGNMELRPDGQLQMYDWQETSIAPGLLDIVVLCDKTEWHYPDMALSADEIKAVYQHLLYEALRFEKSEKEWLLGWSYARLWFFLVDRLEELASATPEWKNAFGERFEAFWLPRLQTALATIERLS